MPHFFLVAKVGRFIVPMNHCLLTQHLHSSCTVLYGTMVGHRTYWRIYSQTKKVWENGHQAHHLRKAVYAPKARFIAKISAWCCEAAPMCLWLNGRRKLDSERPICQRHIKSEVRGQADILGFTMFTLSFHFISC